MSAIYQRARPTTFDEVVGQEHVRDVLEAAIRRDRVGHAYLFSGPRGVGKTTSARLLAMAVNCDADADAARPCGRCDSCRLIQSGSHPDVTELDAASNNSVEDVREMRDQVRLASLRGGTRVWVLDEAHMLSRAAANALLKTLEEPPPRLVFILATTEPEKLPPTILSRCQHFRFRRLSVDEIGGKLRRLCQEAGVEAEEEALTLVARAADGGMRDAESLLERLLATGGAISRSGAEQALGLPPQERIEALADALAAGDLAALLTGAETLYRDGFAPRSLIERLSLTLRDALYHAVTGREGFTLDLPTTTLMRLLHALDEEHERFTRHDDLYALEVSLIKAMNALAGVAPDADRPAVVTTSAPPPAGRSVADPADTPREAAAPAGVAAIPEFDPHQRGDPPKPAANAPERRPLSWHSVKMKAGPQLKAFLMPGREAIRDEQITVHYDDTHRFHFNEVKKRYDELSSLIESLGGPGYTLVIEGPGETVRKKS